MIPLFKVEKEGTALSLRKSTIIEKAQKLVLKGKFKEAVEEWKKLAAETPNDGNIYNAIGDLYLKANDKANATTAFIKAADAFQTAAFELKSIALYKKALKVDPSKIEIYEKLAAVYAERGLIGNAIDDYLKAAKYYSTQGNFRACLAVYRKLASLDPENINIRFEIAEMCQKQEVKEEAVEEYKKVVALYDAKNMASEADAIREKIIALDPSYAHQEEAALQEEPLETPREHPVLEEEPEGDCLSAASEFSVNMEEPEALEMSAGFLEPESKPMAEEQTVFQNEQSIAENLDASHPAEKETANTIQNAITEADVYVQYGLIEKAIDQLQAAATAFPLALKPHLKLREIYTQQGMTENAIEECTYLAHRYEEMGDKSALEAVLEELKQLDPQKVSPVSPEPEEDPFGEPILNEDSLSMEASEPTLAALSDLMTSEHSLEKMSLSSHNIEDVLSGLSEKPEKGDYVDLNEILSEGFGGDADEIETSLEKSFRNLQGVQGDLKGEETETHYDLGIAYKEMGMIPEAMGAFELAAKGNSRFEDAIIMLAACHREEGSTPTAVNVLEQALSKRNSQPGEMIALKYELALLYEKLGDKKSASLYKEIFDTDPVFRDIAKKHNQPSSTPSAPASVSSDQAEAAQTSKKDKRRDRVSYL